MKKKKKDLPEFYFNPEKKIPHLKYLFEEGFIGFDIKVLKKKYKIIPYDLTNLYVNVEINENRIKFFHLNETLELEINIIKE